MKENDITMRDLIDLMRNLQDAARINREMYDKHLEALERSRDVAQANEAELIRANIEMTKTIEKQREDYKFLIDGYRAELQSAKNLYNRTVEAYQRLAERGQASSAEVVFNNSQK